MKKFVSFLVNLVACSIVAFSVQVNARQIGKGGLSDLTGNVNLTYTSNPTTHEKLNYGPGEWPMQFHASGVHSGCLWRVFEVGGLPDMVGHWALFAFSFHSDFMQFVQQVKITVMDENGFLATSITYKADDWENPVIYHGDFTAFDTDTSKFLKIIDGYYIFGIQGTLIRATRGVYVNLEFGDVPFSEGVFDYPGSNSPAYILYSQDTILPPSVDSVTVNSLTTAPYYPGADVQFKADVSGTGIVPGTPESAVYWYVHGNNSADTYIDNNGLLTIADDETAATLEIEVISTYDSTKRTTVSVPVTYPLNLQITPSHTTLITSVKRQEIQFELLLPDGQLFDYSLLEWTTPGADGQYFRIDDNGLLEILPGAPAGSVIVKYAYQHDVGNVSTSFATVTITSQQEGIFDQLNPTPEQSDKADQMEDAIGDAADKLENNNSSLGQLTPTRPQINTNLEFDQEQMLGVSPLVTNIWSINGLGRMISIVLVVATVAYIFFGKRDG